MEVLIENGSYVRKSLQASQDMWLDKSSGFFGTCRAVTLTRLAGKAGP
jgi:hypothetical protein